MRYGVLYETEGGLFGLPTYLPSPSTDHLRDRLHPPRRSAAPPESLEPSRPGAAVRASFPGLPSLIAASSTGVHLTRAPTPAPFRPRRFSRPRRFPPPADFAGLFHPAATSRVRSSGVSPGGKPHGLVARRCPRVVGPASQRVPAFRAFLHPPVRCRTRWFRPRTAPSPPELSLPRVLLRAPWSDLHRSSDHGLPRPSSCYLRAT